MLTYLHQTTYGLYNQVTWVFSPINFTLTEWGVSPQLMQEIIAIKLSYIFG